MKLAKLLAAALFVAANAPELQARPLSELMEEVDATWMVGKWQDKDTSGGVVKLDYEWRLQKHAVAVKYTTPDSNGEGMIAVKPGTDNVVYMAVDDAGGTVMGKWREHEGNPLLTFKHTSSEGEERAMAVEHIKVDNDTLRLKIYKVDSSGDVDTSDCKEVILVRQK